MKTKKIYIFSAIILLAAISRFFSPWPNVTPLGAMALLGGSYLANRWIGVVLPLLALWISNLFLNNLVYVGIDHEFIWFGQSFWMVSFAMVCISFFGSRFLQKRSVSRVAGGALISSLIFYVITNFGVWAQGLMYPMNIGGLISSYVAGIPFFWNTLAGDLFFTGILYGVIEFSFRKLEQPAIS